MHRVWKLQSILSARGMERVSGITMENDKLIITAIPYLASRRKSAHICVPSAAHISLLHIARQGEDTDDTTL